MSCIIECFADIKRIQREVIVRTASIYPDARSIITEGEKGTHTMEKIKVTSEISYTLKIIGGKWKPLILEYLRDNGTQRYMEILRYLEEAPKKTLTDQLRELEDDGIIVRTVLPTVPVQVEYKITKYGESLYPLLNVMCDWGYEHFDNNRYELSHPTCDGKE